MGVFDFVEPSCPDAGAIIARQDPYDADVALDLSDEDSAFWQVAKLYRGRFGEPMRIYYPACGTHMISSFFPASHVTYLDPSENLVAAIRRGMPEALAVAAKAGEFSPEKPFDLVISQNSHADMIDQTKDLRVGGYLLCNSYFGTRDSERAMEIAYLRLVAVIAYVDDDTHAVELVESTAADFAIRRTRADQHIFERIA